MSQSRSFKQTQTHQAFSTSESKSRSFKESGSKPGPSSKIELKSRSFREPELQSRPLSITKTGSRGLIKPYTLTRQILYTERLMANNLYSKKITNKKTKKTSLSSFLALYHTTMSSARITCRAFNSRGNL